jgi:superfamily II DNA/RNA helicase
MRPDKHSKRLLNITKAKAKMWEYDVPAEHHITIPKSPEELFPISIALLGDVAAEINRGHRNSESFKTLEKELPFASEFLNSLLEAKLSEKLSPRLRLLASAAFYLCNQQGNAGLLSNSIEYNSLPNETEGLDILLLWILRGNITAKCDSCHEVFQGVIASIPHEINRFYKDGNSKRLREQIDTLRKEVYASGTDEQLLFGDLIAAIVREKINTASIRLLPKYSGIDQSQWLVSLQKKTFIKEFWPAQRLIGKKGVLLGQSAVVQMPTSAGKTKSIELIIRSAFLSQRTNLAIIVAPFRALCHEIKDALMESFSGEQICIDVLSDTLQNDIDREISEWLGIPSKSQILIVTPEKLLYILRQHPELAEKLKLLIFDEGHQFDTGKRGITYELLLTSLKRFISKDVQKVLISAVIPNADEIAQWLNGDNNIVQGENLIPTKKTIGFSSWKTSLGQIHYVEHGNDTFFVPRVIEEQPLQRQGRERTDRRFPDRGNGQDVALYLGLKLCGNGGVAIFCGRKDTAQNICKRVVEIAERGYEIKNIRESSDESELRALSSLCAENLGQSSIEARSAELGVLAHHSNIPHGIRIAVEHAMRTDRVRLIVCTSTLAQGVNLPIRYLIVASFYQGQKLIKVRDFHNLIGRAGRSGKHVEGSILFAEPKLYDERTNRKENWRWKNAQNLLDVSKSERCVSSLLDLFEPIHNGIHGYPRSTIGEYILPFETLIEAYIENRFHKLIPSNARELGDSGVTPEVILPQLMQKRQMLESIENFLMAHWEDIENNPTEQASELSKQTFAYHLADEKKKPQIAKVFQLLAKKIAQKVPENERKKTFGRTLYGLYPSLKIEDWVNNNKRSLLAIKDVAAFFDAIWVLFCNVIESGNPKGVFAKFTKPEMRKNILLWWLTGRSFADILCIIKRGGVRKHSGQKQQDFTVEDMVDICENTFAFDGMLVVGAIIEFLDASAELDQSTKEQFQLFQKQLKYGLPTLSSISVYELGFSDRVVAQKIAALLKDDNCTKSVVSGKFKDSKFAQAIKALQFPSYYNKLLRRFANQ